MKRYTPPKYGKGQQVKIFANGFVSRVIRISYTGGANWYEVKDSDGINKHLSENEIGRV